MVGNFRRFLRQSLRTAARVGAMVGVVGLVSIGMISASSQQAQADAGVIAAEVLPEVLGATEAALPEVMAGEAVTGPGGWGLLVPTAGLFLALTIYSTRDSWGPWVAGTFGQASPDQTNVTGDGTQYAKHLAGLTLTSPLTKVIASTTAGEGLTTTIATVPGSRPPTTTYVVAMAVECQKTDGTTYVRGTSATLDWANGAGVSTGTDRCNGTTEKVIAGSFGAQCAIVETGVNPCTSTTNSIQGPVDTVTWGQWAPTGFDPHSSGVTYQTTVECMANDGTKVNLSKTWTGDMAGMIYPSCEAAGLGHGDGGLTVTGKGPTDANSTTLLQRAPVAPDVNHPLCGANVPGPGCKLQVLIDGKPCVVGDWTCINWKRIDQSRVQCWYGPYQMDLSECNMLERAYEDNGVPLTAPNTDGDPTTASDLNLNGQPQPPKGDPSTATVNGTVPGVGGAPAAGDTAGQDCFPNGWGMLNPAEWVLKPIGCALQSAFVPKTQTVNDTSTKIQNSVNSVGFGTVTTAWVNTFNQVGGGSGCAGPTVTFNFGGVSQSLQPFNACDAPMSIVAGITYAFSSVIIVLAGGLGVARAISSGFGFNFSLGSGSSQ